MKTVCIENKCNGCKACYSVCPNQCISIKSSIEYFNAIIDEDKCINCGLCEETCPNTSVIKTNKPILWKQGWVTDDIRKDSSSGGIASFIIKEFIKDGGYVASCIFNNGDFVFDITNDLDFAKKFAGSKYVKSNMDGIYEKIANRIKTNKVLFVGLPCQVAAVKNYIKDDTNLYTIGLICHGTPSIEILRKYLLEKGFDINKIKDIKFRNKTDMSIFKDQKKIYDSLITDEYTLAFLRSIDYTENCYSCQYASLERVSDITLGDSWGTELKDELDKGVSLILVQTEKGREILNNENIVLKDVDIQNAIKNNGQLSHPSILTNKRKRFMSYIDRGMSISLATLLVLPKDVIKQRIKYILIKLNLYKPHGGID